MSPAQDARSIAASAYAPALHARADALARGERTPYAFAEAVIRYFSHGFRYDTLPAACAGRPDPRLPARHTMLGYCQQFAGAMALVLLRMGGVPAHVADRLHAGNYDRSAHGAYLVTDTEARMGRAWFPGIGWVTFDPTPPADAASARATVVSSAVNDQSTPPTRLRSTRPPRRRTTVHRGPARRRRPGPRRPLTIPLGRSCSPRRPRTLDVAPACGRRRAGSARRSAGRAPGRAGARFRRSAAGRFPPAVTLAELERRLGADRRGRRIYSLGSRPLASPTERSAERLRSGAPCVTNSPSAWASRCDSARSSHSRRPAALSTASLPERTARSLQSGTPSRAPTTLGRPDGRLRAFHAAAPSCCRRPHFHQAVIPLTRARDLAPDKTSIREALGRALFHSQRYERRGGRVPADRRACPRRTITRCSVSGAACSRLGRHAEARRPLALAACMQLSRRGLPRYRDQARARAEKM